MVTTVKGFDGLHHTYVSHYSPNGVTVEVVPADLNSGMALVYVEVTTTSGYTFTKVTAEDAERLAVALIIAAKAARDARDARCTSDDPNDHQGDTCPVHEDDPYALVRALESVR